MWPPRWRWNRLFATPRRRLHSSAVNIPAFEEFDLHVLPVAHQVQHGTHLLASRMRLGKLTIPQMNFSFRRRHGRDATAFANVDGAESQDVAEKRAVGYRIFAVEQEMRHDDHGAEYIRDESRSLT